MIPRRNGEIYFGSTRWFNRASELTPHARIITVTKLPSGEMFEEACDVLVTARGQLNNMSWPKIPGLETFKGPIMHSGGWDER